MSDSLFSLSSLAIVTPVVALATYVIVLNLDRITKVFVPLIRSTPTIPSSPIRNFISSQARRMQRDQSMVWRGRGDAFEKSDFPRKSGRRPSRWRVLQSVVRGIFLPIWNFLITIFVFYLPTVLACCSGRRRRTDDESIPTSARNLGDVEVQVQVDVNVEKREGAPIAASSL